MYRGRKVSIVVPAHNEERKIEGVILGVPDFVDHIVITDDCSSDKTAEVAQKSTDPRVFVIRHESNSGVGGAVLSAHKKAISLGSEINVVMAGDGQMDPQYLSMILDPLVDGTHAYVKGNRLSSKDSYSTMPKYRVFGNFILSFLNKVASGYWDVTDAQNGYTGILSCTLIEIDFETISQGYEFENSMLSRLNQFSMPVLDVSIPAIYADEVSGIKLASVIPALLKHFIVAFCSRVYLKYLKTFKLVPWLCTIGLVVGVASFLFGLISLGWMIVVISAGVTISSFVIMGFYDFTKSPKPWEHKVARPN